MTQLVFVGLVLTDKGIGPTEDKCELSSMQESHKMPQRSEVSWDQQTTMLDLSQTLPQLTQKGVRFEFGDEQRKAFTELKKRLSSAEILGYFEKDGKTLIITDASPVGLGAVLIQQQHGVKRIISYASKSLSDVEKRYSQIQTEKEALAIVWACERFHVYLYGISIRAVHGPQTARNDLLQQIKAMRTD